MPPEKTQKASTITKKKRGIIKANRNFFQDARYGLSLLEHRIVYFAILTGQQNGTPFEPVTISVSEFKEVCGLTGNSSYSQLTKITKNLIQKSVEIIYMDDSGRHLTQATWVTTVKYHQKTGTVTIVPNKELQMFFNNPKRNYSTTEFYYLVKFTCQYAERLYELFKSLDFKSIIDFSIEELREKLAVKKKYPNYKDFRARVLDPAIEDINKYTDLNVDYREQRGAYNKINLVMFSIHKKSVPLLYDREQNGEFLKHKISDAPIEGQLLFWDDFDFMKDGDISFKIEKAANGQLSDEMDVET